LTAFTRLRFQSSLFEFELLFFLKHLTLQ